MPRVTVIIATYNWSSVLPYSIGSALQQTFTDFELLVIGDGCTDDSEQIVAKIQDDRVRWINLPENTGSQSGPNNEGLRQARGDIIAYLGHDDLWFPRHLELLVEAIDAGSDVVYSISLFVHTNGQKHVHYQYSPGGYIPPSSLAHRRSVGEKIGGWRDYREIERDEQIDMDFEHRAHDHGFQFHLVQRLSVVKFLAAHRRDVYRTRPCHEQAEWFSRIGKNLDFGDHVATEMMLEFLAHKPFRVFVAGFFKEIINRTKFWLPKLFRQKRRSAREVFESRRKYKGL